jgi:hypothetical protein
MTALRIVALAPMRVRGVSRAKADELAMEMLNQVGLADKANTYLHTLWSTAAGRDCSGTGHGTWVLLFDEVTSALDPELVGRCQISRYAQTRSGWNDDGCCYSRDAVCRGCGGQGYFLWIKAPSSRRVAQGMSSARRVRIACDLF